MASIVDFSINRGEDSSLTINLAPPSNIGGVDISFVARHRFGGESGIIVKSCASGYGGGVSGITVTNSGNGGFKVTFNHPDTSGIDFSNLAYSVERTLSGSVTVLTEGFVSIMPSMQP